MNGLDKFIKKCLEYRQIYIYGDGEVGRLIRVYLHEQKLDISGFLTTYTPQKKRVMAVPVCELRLLHSAPSDTLIIICMHKKWWNEATKNIEKYGYTNFIIVDDELRLRVECETLFADLYEDVEHRINVLLYHRVENLETSYSIIVSERNFEDQLKYICSNYKVLRCDEDWSGVDRKSVALTFDDGYVDFYTKTYPLLKKHNVPATVFISTGGIDNDNEFWWDELENIINQPYLPDIIRTRKKAFCVRDYQNKSELIMDVRGEIICNTYRFRDEEISYLKSQVNPRLMNRPQYRTMNTKEIIQIAKDPLITVGAHTINHILCDIENESVQMTEIEKSKKRLEEIINREVSLFAYPNGNIGSETRGILSELGFTRAFTCEHACIDRDEHVFDIPRSAVLNWDYSQIERRFRGMWQTSKDI